MRRLFMRISFGALMVLGFVIAAVAGWFLLTG
jgi:hypothetical protein